MVKTRRRLVVEPFRHQSSWLRYSQTVGKDTTEKTAAFAVAGEIRGRRILWPAVDDQPPLDLPCFATRDQKKTMIVGVTGNSSS